VKGGDYTIDTLPEAKIVQAAGGRVEFIPFVDGHSTTSVIEKIKASDV
jgi:glycerol-3-phosphate cytidylyltransferase